LLETVRDFALGRLDATDEGDAVRRRHLEWCLEATRQATGLLRGPLHTVALDRLAAIDADIRAALDFALRPATTEDDRARLASGHDLLVTATSRYWYRFGNVPETRRWQERGLQLASDVDSAANVGMLHGLGMSLIQQVELDRAIETLRRALEMAERLDDPDAQARELNALGIAYRMRQEPDAAMEALSRSLALASEAGNRQVQGFALANMVVVHIDLCDYAEAARVAREAMRMDEQNEDDWGLAIDRLNYAFAVLNLEGADAALALFADWAPGILALRDNELLIDVMEFGAAILSGHGDYGMAVRLLGGADARRAAAQMLRSAAEEAVVERWLGPARTALGAAWADAHASGRGLTSEQAVEIVLSTRVRQDS
jgi:tetratricopeptide (TPR) repeat protein